MYVKKSILLLACSCCVSSIPSLLVQTFFSWAAFGQNFVILARALGTKCGSSLEPKDMGRQKNGKQKRKHCKVISSSSMLKLAPKSRP